MQSWIFWSYKWYWGANCCGCLGAEVIEKHLTLNKNMKGPDHKASLEPKDFKNMVKSIRNIEKSLGIKKKFISKSEKKNF